MQGKSLQIKWNWKSLRFLWHPILPSISSNLYCEKHESQLNSTQRQPPPTKIRTIIPSKTNPCFVPGSLNRCRGCSYNNFHVKNVANIWCFFCHSESSHRAFWYEPARLNRSFPVRHRERTNCFLVWIATWNANRFCILHNQEPKKAKCCWQMYSTVSQRKCIVKSLLLSVSKYLCNTARAPPTCFHWHLGVLENH